MKICTSSSSIINKNIRWHGQLNSGYNDTDNQTEEVLEHHKETYDISGNYMSLQKKMKKSSIIKSSVSLVLKPMVLENRFFPFAKNPIKFYMIT